MRNEDRMQAPMPAQSTAAPSYHVPTDIVELPSKGVFYPEGHPWHNKREVEVRYMTAKEESILLTQAYKERGITFIKLVQSIALDQITGHEILPGDLTAIVVNARKNAYGREYTPNISCPFCSTRQDVSIDLEDVKCKTLNTEEFNERGELEIILPILKSKITLKLLREHDEKEIEKRIEASLRHNLPENALIERYRQVITSVDGKQDLISINNLIEAMPIKDSAFLKEKYANMIPDISYKLEHECVKCKETIEGGLPLTGDFFRLNQ